jgi:hypothetical protein
MELKGIKGFLDKYKQSLFQFDNNQHTIISVIKSISGVELNESDFLIKKHTLELKTNSIKKNQIFLYKTHIISELKNCGITTIFEIN